MSFSIQTNVNALVAQENLRVNSNFQSQTITRLTSGYRINSSGDDAAGLAVANKYRSDTAELAQGVRNANDGISTLQIVDGGLNNISKMLDRLKTLATQSASSTFTGNRTTLNNEYQDLLGEITRQASNVGLVSGGANNNKMSVYTGGGNIQGNAQVSVDLSGGGNRVDAVSLGIGSSSVQGGGSTLTLNSVNTLNNSTQTFLASGAKETFTFNIYDENTSTTTSVSAAITGTTGGISASEGLRQLNASLNQWGISATANGDGYLMFGSTRAFSVTETESAATGLATTNSHAVNQAMYRFNTGAYSHPDDTAQTLTFASSAGMATATLAVADATAAAITSINAQTAALGIYAVKDEAGTGISLQSATDFTVNYSDPDADDSANGGIGSNQVNGTLTITDAAVSASSIGQAQAAITAISNAVSYLGLVQGKVGTGQNKLQYAINLAQSQISNFSAAESRIRDADVASEAANLTKAQVLQQASMAAMAQANSAPQAVLSLLRG